jgi:hypothetical protein
MRLKSFVPLFAALFLFLAASAAAGENRFAPLVESFAGGWIDWREGAIYGIGRGLPDMHRGSHPMARRAAKVIALQSILKIAAGIRLDDRRTLQDLAAGSGAIQLEALIQFTEHRQLWVDNVSRPYYETVLRAPMTGIGGLTARLLQALGSRPMNRRLPAGPLPDEDQPWLVLDARRAGRTRSVTPALFPRIVSESGRPLYDSDLVEPEALIVRGMARYVTAGGPGSRLGFSGDRPGPAGGPFLERVSAQGETKGGPAGSAPVIVKEVVSVRGAAGTELVVSQKDAKSVANEDAASRILRRCRVIILVPHRTGAVQSTGSRPVPDPGTGSAPFRLPMPASAGRPVIGHVHPG